MHTEIKAIRYPEARHNWYAAQVKKAKRKLELHVAKMADGRLNGYDYAVQDKASELGAEVSYLNDAEKLFGDDEFGTICLCAVRYSLGRMTCMPTLVQDYIKRHKSCVSDGELYTITRDVQNFERMGHSYGMECDRYSWEKFLAWCRTELTARGHELPEVRE